MRTLVVPCFVTVVLLGPGSPGPIPAAAQVRAGGQVRPRAEVRDPVDGGTEAFTSMRTRAWLTADLTADAAVFVQL
ncbi:MAG TPA: hypothetical protein VE173_00655, partial [Longimicrobiales bacterium]|nr:hypothetical protein [Longimicrobiales bacterium]